MMNTTKSEQIRAGLQKSFWSGTSAKASTVCYGYSMASTGNLLICPTEVVIVFHIFDCFIWCIWEYPLPLENRHGAVK